MSVHTRFQAGAYYGSVRADLVGWLPRPIGRVLDVGCGEAASAQALRDAGASAIVGIEIVPEAAEIARGRLDEVHVGTVQDALPGLEPGFDTIVVWDVLEHLADPYSVVRQLHDLAAPGGRIEVSVPNARHLSLVADLMLRGTFGYTDWGHRDRTHLRWFTRRDLVAMLKDAGWRDVETKHAPLGRTAALGRLTGDRAAEFFASQWYALGRRG